MLEKTIILSKNGSVQINDRNNGRKIMDPKNKNVKENDTIENDVSEAYRINRRTFMKVAGATVGAIALGTGLSKLIEPAMGARMSLTKFVDPLPIPPVAGAVINPSYPFANYYEIAMAPSLDPAVAGKLGHKFHRDLPYTQTYGYGGASYLGPTIVATKGTPVVIKFTNSLPTGLHLLTSAIDTTIMGSSPEEWIPGNPPPQHWNDENRVCVHLHGGKVPIEFDGGPIDWFSPVGSKQANPYPDAATVGLMDSYIYQYPNDQAAATLWYHDHAWGITRFNPFAGLAAAYLIRDTDMNDLIDGTNVGVNNILYPPGNTLSQFQRIPGGVYEVPIVLQDKLLNLLTGAMIYPVAANPAGTHPIWIPEYFGDTPVVNGKAYPYLNVEPRRYLFHFLNGSNARFYNVWFDNGLGPVPFNVIGSEQGFLSAQAMLSKLLIAPGERFDVIFDFTGMLPGKILTLKNNAKAPYPGGMGGMGQIMQFRVIPIGTADNTTPANALVLPPIALTPTPTVGVTPREIVLSEIMDPVTGLPMEALLDGLHFTDTLAPNDPLFTEAADSVNVWQFINTTGDAHPMHPHLVPFKILNRQKFDVAGFTAAWNAWILGGRNPSTRPSINNPIYLTKVLAYGPAPEETGWKDTAKAYPGEVLRIVSKFELPADAPTGLNRYVCHCHILEHEENDMMFNYGVNKP